MSEKKVGKRLLTWVLVLVMTLSLLPLNVLAAGEAEAEPADKLTQEVSDENFSMTKSATSNADGSYTITLSVTPKQVPETKPLELVVLLDLSGSMAWCTRSDGHEHKDSCWKECNYSDHWYKDDHFPYNRHHIDGTDCTPDSWGYYWYLTCGYHTHEGGTFCAPVQDGSEASRISIATNAISSMISTLQEKGINFKLSVVKFASKSKQQWDNNGYNGAYTVISKMSINAENIGSVSNTLNSLTPGGGTYMVPGLEVAEGEFSNDSTSQKVLVMLADGDYNDEDAYEGSSILDWRKVDADERINNAANDIKGNNDVTVYTIGFTTDVAILKSIATDPSHYSTAGSSTALNGIMQQIAADIKTATVTDDMGTDVSLVAGSAQAANGSGSVTTSGNGLTWTLGKLEKEVTQSITYDVTISDLKPGKHPYNLNGGATLTSGDETLTVDAPYVILSAYQVNIEYYVDGVKVGTKKGDVTLFPEDGVLYDWSNEPDSYNGAAFSKAVLNDEDQMGTSATLTEAREYTLKLYYVNGYTVTYKVDGKQVGEPVSYPFDTEVTVLPKYTPEDGYSVTDWSSKDVAFTDGKFSMPAKNVTISATTSKNSYTVTYLVDGKQVGEPVSYPFDTEVTVLPKYTPEDGYSVTDWSSKDVAFTDGKFSMPAKNVTISATTSKNSYTVTYLVDGKQVGNTETYQYGDLVTVRDKYNKPGYTVSNWSSNDVTFTNGKFNMPAKNVTITATSTKNGGYHPRPKPTVEIEDDDALGLNTTDHFAYIVGYGNGEVRPQNNITRAEVATIFFRLLTDDVRDENLTKTNRYSDVAATSWYNTAVSTLSSMGIITGYPDGTFRPNAAITRAEFAAIAARFDSNGDKTAAKFSDIANHWAKDEISIAYNNGWITGYPNGTFGPQRDITRAETMTLVNRVLNRQPETEDDLLPNMTVWTDNANPNAWYYLAVQEATNSHYYKFKTNSKYEKWTELRETRDWTQLEK